MKIYEIQENCDRDANDCRDCNSGLYHMSTAYASLQAADLACRDNLRELMAHEVDNLDPDKVEITKTETSGQQYNQEHNRSWTYEAKYGDKVSQWHYDLYEMTPCEQCHAFSCRGHIH